MGPAFSLAEALLARDPDTYLHSQRTAAYAEMLATELGLGAERTQQIATAGLLHDVGKIAVPDAILYKREPLTDAEWAIVRDHSTIGASIVESGGLVEIAHWIRHLHERFDGHGYPDGLAGQEIPFESRLLHATDVLEAMTSERPYRSAVSMEQAAAEIEAVAGTQLDPVVALPLVEVVCAHGLRISAARRTRRRRLPAARSLASALSSAVRR